MEMEGSTRKADVSESSWTKQMETNMDTIYSAITGNKTADDGAKKYLE
jgi:hypothetical protein